MAPQLKRAVKSRARGTGKRIVERQLIKCISTENLEKLFAETEKGTKFKGELRRKVKIELDRRAKAAKDLLSGKTKRQPKRLWR